MYTYTHTYICVYSQQGVTYIHKYIPHQHRSYMYTYVVWQIYTYILFLIYTYMRSSPTCCIYIHIYSVIYIYIYILSHMYTYTFLTIVVYICTHTSFHVFIYISIVSHIYTCKSWYTCIYIYVPHQRIHIHTYMHTFFTNIASHMNIHTAYSTCSISISNLNLKCLFSTEYGKRESSNRNLIGLFSAERGKRDLEN